MLTLITRMQASGKWCIPNSTAVVRLLRVCVCLDVLSHSMSFSEFVLLLPELFIVVKSTIHTSLYKFKCNYRRINTRSSGCLSIRRRRQFQSNLIFTFHKWAIKYFPFNLDCLSFGSMSHIHKVFELQFKWWWWYCCCCYCCWLLFTT